MSRRLTFVVNPRSQNGALGRRWPRLGERLGDVLGAFDVRMTEAPGDATRLTREALAGGADVVAAVGGDGTIHEVANGFFDAQGRPTAVGKALGVLPFGTGGDFRRTAGIPAELDAAAAILAADRRRPIDAGLLEYREGGVGGPLARRVFINIASFGLGGLVDKIVNQSSKVLGGRLSFVLGTARAGLRYENQRVRMVFDDDEAAFVEATISNVAVANGQYFGGGMRVAPAAALDDGIFDVITLGDLSLWDFLKDGVKVYRGTHTKLAKVDQRRARTVQARPVDPGAEILLDVDGEALGALPARFSILPASLHLVVP